MRELGLRAVGGVESSACDFPAGLLQAAHQGFDAGQSLERLLHIVAESDPDALVQSIRSYRHCIRIISNFPRFMKSPLFHRECPQSARHTGIHLAKSPAHQI